MSEPFKSFILSCAGHGKGVFTVTVNPPSQDCGIERKQFEFIEQAINEKLARRGEAKGGV